MIHVRKFLPFLVIATILISGCISQTSASVSGEGYGLEITEFSADRSELYSGQTLHLSLKMENQGESKVYKSSSLALLIVPEDWEVVSSSGTSGNLHKKVKLAKDLDPPDETRGIPGDSGSIRWTLKAPSITNERTDTMYARVYYDYNTRAMGKIWIYPESERFEENKKLSTDTFTSTRGPIDIDISVIPDPVVAEFEGEIITLQILLTNVGNGVPYTPGKVNYDLGYSITEDDRNNITLYYITHESIDTLENTCPSNVQLIDGSAVVMCDLNITGKISAKQSYPIEIRAEYGYIVEKEIEVKVLEK